MSTLNSEFEQFIHEMAKKYNLSIEEIFRAIKKMWLINDHIS